MIVTKEFLKRKTACKEGVKWYLKQKTTDAKTLFDRAIKDEKLGYIDWCLVKKMTKKQRIMYAIFSAEQVIDIFEREYPNDNRPRLAIEAAKAYLQNPCKVTESAASAAYAAASAAYIYSAYAASAAASAAYGYTGNYIIILTYGYKLLTSEVI